MLVFTALAVIGFSLRAAAQSPKDLSSYASDATAGHGHILLVLPFDTLPDPLPTSPSIPPGTQAVAPVNLDWLREAIPEILSARFTSVGFFPLTREDRLYALDHLGLPETFQPSRATALRIAETLDADYILIGSYATSGPGGATLTVKARIVDVARLRLWPEAAETGQISQLIPLVNTVAWRLTRQLDPGFGVAQETFRAADSKLHLDAFEQYIRGITERDSAERLRHLKKATELNPDFSEAWLATGKLQFANQQFEQAAVSFGKVADSPNENYPSALEATFYRGLSLMFSGNYPRADDAFAAVARVLPLPEVVNNEAVAGSRRGHDAIALFRQAEVADPTDPDYHFNLAVSLHRHGDNAEALTELAQSLKLHPNDSEAKAAEAAWKAAVDTSQAKTATTDPNSDPGPLERIKRTYDGAAFRQAALMVEEVEATRLAALPGPARAAKLAASAREKLDRGLLLEAERGYQAALAADDHSADAHAGLAEVRERAGDIEAARKEAQAALDRQPNLEAYLVLARLDLSQNHLPEARVEAAEAVKLDASSRAAKELRRTIDYRIDAKPSPPAKP